MTARWAMTPLGEVATPVARSVRPIAGETYRQIGVRLWGEGAYERDVLDGGATKYGVLYRVEAGDIIVNKIWARNGSVAVVLPELAGCLASGEFPIFAPRRERLESRWFHWITKARWFWRACDEHARGTSGKNRIRPEKFLEISIPLPPLPEQRRIVAKIDELAWRIAEARGVRGCLTGVAAALIPARLNTMFGNYYSGIVGELPIDSFPALADLTTDVADGPHITPMYTTDGIPFITVLNITSGRIRFGDHKYITRQAYDEYCGRATAERGDVLISKDGTIGIPCFVDTDRPFGFFVSVALVKPLREKLDGEYLTWALRAPYLKSRMRERSRGDMIRHLVLREIRALNVPLIPIDEQRCIVAYLDDLQGKVDRLKELQAQAAAELDALLPAILDKAFKGEL